MSFMDPDPPFFLEPEPEITGGSGSFSFSVDYPIIHSEKYMKRKMS